MFFSKKLKKFQNIRHCFFSRKNGISQGIYKSLNCGLGSGDNKENVLKNLELVSKKIGCKQESLITLNQRHTNKAIYFSSNTDVKTKLEGDAIVSKVKNIGIVKKTASAATAAGPKKMPDPPAVLRAEPPGGDQGGGLYTCYFTVTRNTWLRIYTP